MPRLARYANARASAASPISFVAHFLMSTLNASLVLQAAASAADTQSFPMGALYVVATPIGNMADLTLRAVHVLSLVDAIACEDTRQSGQLLRQIGVDRPLLPVHQHNEHEGSALVLARLQRGERVAYVSDAGTPGISDPGAVLVAAATQAGFRCIPIPGACSGVAALSVSGDANGATFEFVGFLASRGSHRTRALQRLVDNSATQVLFEAPHRIEALAHSLATCCADRRVTLCRELTKQFETVITLAAADLPAWLAADSNRSRGEFVLVIHASTAESVIAEATQHDTMLRTLLAELPLRQAVALGSKLSGASRNALYERALELKQYGD
jgi:16S rRNA (cytidine1402-2'-O)-methyltransferase